MGVRLGSGDGIEDADEFVLPSFANGFDDLVSNRRVLVVEDLDSPTALAEVKVVCAGNRDNVDSRGRSQLSRHGADGR